MRLRGLHLLVVFCTSVCSGPVVRADDWPQWRGPNRDGISRESDWLWPEGTSPQVAWHAEVGKGHSAVSVTDGRAYTLGWDGERDTVFCLDIASGQVLWKQSYPCSTILQWPGPRATPTVHAGVVYTLGQHGQLRTWDARTGQPGWAVDLPNEYMPDVDYGFAWSPLIEGDLVILNAAAAAWRCGPRTAPSPGATIAARARAFRPCRTNIGNRAA